MQCFRLLALLAWAGHLITAYLTHATMLNLTVLTNDLRERIGNGENGGNGVGAQEIVLNGGGGEESDFGGFDD